MTTIEPSKYICVACKDEAIHYADGVIWCETCGKAKSLEHLIDRSKSPRWQAFERRHAQVVGRTPREQKLYEASLRAEPNRN